MDKLYCYDQDGYDREGHNHDGYDRDGYGRSGYDRDGHDRNGYNCYGFNRDGYNRDGYNCYGYNRDGCHCNSFKKQLLTMSDIVTDRMIRELSRSLADYLRDTVTPKIRTVLEQKEQNEVEKLKVEIIKAFDVAVQNIL